MSSAPEPGRGEAAEEKTGDGAAGEGVRENGSAEREAASGTEKPLRKPAEAAGPVEAVTPVEPVEAVQPSEPVGAVQPSEPVGAVEAAEPVEAVAPVEPVKPVEPLKEKEKAEPVEAARPQAGEVRKTEGGERKPDGEQQKPQAEVEEPEVAAAPAEAAEPAPAPQDADRGAGRRRLKAALWPPRLSRGQLVVALLLFSLGLALAIQVRSTNDHHSQLRGARQEDLVRILDELDGRQQRLQQEKAELEQSLAKLENSSNQAKEAQEQTRKKVTELGVLAGTVKATGPGIVLTVDDPQGQVKADMLLDTLQELRAAGAEAIQINDVRVVVNTYFTDLSGGGVQIDGKKVSQPYRFTVVGNPQDLTPALNIPGGVVRTLESHQARATISQQQKVVVDALVDLKTPQYAKPAPK
ncbi:DUF4573 domain-containing protein [Kitasatospora sp. NBC_00085]|uniref:DUF881 domain-containing protein n=1 Tax=unclassified Kitasatospora TaxID=2633591 RepID=UPI00324B64EF